MKWFRKKAPEPVSKEVYELQSLYRAKKIIDSAKLETYIDLGCGEPWLFLDHASDHVAKHIQELQFPDNPFEKKR